MRIQSSPWFRLLVTVLLGLLIAAGGALRFAHINWDQLQHVHPDERFIVWVADTISWPGDLSTALDPARSTLNPLRWPPEAGLASTTGETLSGKPRNYAYGHVPLYLLVVVAHAVEAVAGWFGRTTITFPAVFQPIYTIGRHLAEYNYLQLVARALSAGADLGVLLLVYALGRRVGDAGARGRDETEPSRRHTHYATGLLAATFYAFAVLPIQLSHFGAVDTVLTFFVTATVALAAHWADRTWSGDRASHYGWGAWLLGGALAGLAVGTKFSAVLLALPLGVAALYGLPAATLRRRALIVTGRLLALAAVGLAVFALTNPFAIIEFPAYVSQITAQNAMVSGVMDAPYTRQYIGTPPYLYFIQQLSQWGLGWPVGLLAWGGFLWAIVAAARRRASPALVVMLAWALPYFALTGAFHTKFLRYLAPLLPCLIVFGAGAALAGYRWLRARWGGRGRGLWTVFAIITVVFTAGWALAFTGIYRQEHPWITASRWIYTQIPDGKKLLTEHWDDALPLTLDELPGKPASRSYQRVELPLWDPDTPTKVETLVAELSTADYIILASNRLSAPMARLSGRYPMSSQYYRMLFRGDLGYRLVAEFSAYPRIGGLTIRDDHADESFTVYDHPRVLVFENVDRLKPELLRAKLGRYLPVGAAQDSSLESHRNGSSVVAPLRMTARPPGLARILPQAPAPGAPLTLDQPVDTLPAVADFRWNRAASASAPLATLLWWLALSLFGWLAWPLLFPLLGGLRDRGYGLARVAGWLSVGFVHWLGVSLGWWQNRIVPIALLTGLLWVAGLAAAVIQRRALAAFWRAQRRWLWGEEALFAGAFLAFVGVRLLNPDLWQPWNGGEKFMEFAFLNAILRSPHFPPYDPYFAGGIINYYYFGLYLVSLLIKLTGIASEVAFNLAVPGLFALTALGLFSVGSSLAWRQKGGGVDAQRGEPRISAPLAGGLAVFLALLMGNLRGLGWWAGAWVSVVSGKGVPAYDYWAASRVIPNTINEFPLWTFTFADLHPHMIAMPIGLLVVGLALNWVLGGDQGSGIRDQALGDGEQAVVGSERSRRGAVRSQLLVSLFSCLLIALALGALGAVNTWDLPTYALLVVGAFVLAGWRSARRWRGAIGGVLLSGAVVSVAAVAYLPFYTHYQAQVGEGSGPLVGRFLGWVRAASPLSEWLTIWGFFLFLALIYVMSNTTLSPDVAQTPPLPYSRRRLIALLGLLGALALLAGAGRPTAALAALPLCLALPLVFRRRAVAGAAFLALLLVLGLGLVVGIELIYLRDFLQGGDWYRMNTLFKFSVPAWLLLGLAGGVMWPSVWHALRSAPGLSRLLMRAALVVMLAGGLAFLLVGVRARVQDRFPGPRPALGTLDGTAYMTVGRYTWPTGDHPLRLAPEHEAIRWLLDNVSGSPVIAEAPAGGYAVNGQSVGYDYYRAGGLRVASLTGFPTFVGQHQYEQRPAEQVGPRFEQGKEFFATTDIARTRQLMADLRVGYVYVGTLERILFASESLHKFDVMAELGDLVVVYRNSDITIYQVVEPGR